MPTPFSDIIKQRTAEHRHKSGKTRKRQPRPVFISNETDHKRGQRQQSEARRELQPHGQKRCDRRRNDPNRTNYEGAAHFSAIASGKAFVQVEIVPAPRQTNISPGWPWVFKNSAKPASSSTAWALL